MSKFLKRQRRRSTLVMIVASSLLPQGFAAQLPIPCAAGSCTATGPTTFVTSGAATAVQSGKNLTINQTSAQATLNWASFNVSADGKVVFQQPNASSIALNRIFQANPSTILGQVQANGQIYLINPNGFVFGSTASVNVAGMIASSLQISDSTFKAGLLAPQLLQNQVPALQAGPPVLDANGNPIAVKIDIAAGAQISAPGGRILIAAPTVNNAGTLSAPDGQIVLAAGQQVFLQASTDPALRGLVVEVDGGGTVANQLAGQLNAARGNVSLIGLAVNQDGRISATTSVAANGSVILRAADTTTITPNSSTSFTIGASHGGTLELGAQSSIDILPELSSSATAVAAQPQLQSNISLEGEQVFFHGGSIKAPNAKLNVLAAENGNAVLGVQTDGNPDAQIRIDSGTSIDLSGSDAEVPMAANLLAIQLRANELADDPTQRNGALRGQTVYVDARVGSPLISKSALAAAIANIAQPIAQRTEIGGTAVFESEGDVVFQKGASINVSGGKSTYDGGTLQTTQVTGANGRLYDIGVANPLLTYKGVINPTFTQTFNNWGVQNIVATPGLSHYEMGYVQGASAGSVQFAAPSMVLSGKLAGQVVNGTHQRSGSNVAQGGQLIIGLPNGLSTTVQPDFLAPSLSFVAKPTPVVVSDDTPLPAQTLQLPVDYLVNGGFTRTNIYSNGIVTLPAGLPINLNPGGSLSIDAARVDILSSITSIGGNVQLQDTATIEANTPTIPRAGIQIGDGVVFDVRGQWTNDSPNQSVVPSFAGQTLANGGSISLSSGAVGSELIIGNHVSFEASGGAWLQSTGTLTGGTGGAISIAGAPLNAAVQLGNDILLDAFGVNGAQGGSFSFTAPRLQVGNFGANWAGAQRMDDLSAPGAFTKISSSLFSNDGFSSITLTADGPLAPGAPANSDILTVLAGTAIVPQAKTLQVRSGYSLFASSSDISDLTKLVTLPTASRLPVNVSLNVTPELAANTAFTNVGLLDFQAGASIKADPGAAISLTGVGGIYVDGTLSAPGGTITLHTPKPDPDSGFLPDLRIELGAQAILSAAGTIVYTPNDQNLLLGTVLSGGSINLFADRGSVVADRGSQINISGSTGTLDIPTAYNSPVYARYTVPSAGGSLVVQAPESISLLGDLQAHAGIGNYGLPAAGSLEVDLTRLEAWFTPPSDGLETFPTTPRLIELVSDTAGMSASSSSSGLAVLGVRELGASGIDALRLEAGDEIHFSSNLPLTLARQAIFDAPVIAVDPGVNASVKTAYAYLGNSLPTAAQASPTAGTGNISVNAEHIDLVGSFVLQDVAKASFNSSGDISLLGALIGGSPTGNLSLAGNLNLSAARIFPATGTTFDITATGAGNTVDIAQTTASPGTPLSAGGTVSISADQITSSGTLLAPFGTINLSANVALDLQAGSLTSVSAAGMTIPYGQTQLGGLQWIYAPVGAPPTTVTGIPQRNVNLTAPSVSVASGATVKLSGGGDLSAYEWVPGTGGSTNALAANVTPGLYAVIPSQRGQYAPYDPAETPGTSLLPGESIYLSGGSGLAAGLYPLLPATYALLPGAFLVQVQPGYSNIVPGQQASLGNNTPVVAGYLTFGNTGLHNGGYVGVAVWPQGYAQEIASYQISDASTFFPAAAIAANLPPPASTADAGRLSIAVQNSLNFLGTVEGNTADSPGVSSSIDISALRLEVTGTDTSPLPAGTVGIAASVIRGWKAGELLLGGTASGDGSDIAVTANTVTIDSGAQVSADQVILVANQSIDLRAGSALASTSASPGGKAPKVPPAEFAVSLSGSNPGGAALVAVSDLSLPIVRLPSTATGGATVHVESGASVASLGALSFNGPGGTTLAGSLSGAGASWSLASGSIGFGGAGSSSDTLQINSALLSTLQTAGALRLQSAGAIDLYGPVALGVQSAGGKPTFDSLTIAASALNNQAGGAAVLFGAKQLTLEGGTDPAMAALPAATGSLTFISNELDIGPGTMTLGGFSNTSIHSLGAVVGKGTGDLAVSSGDLSIVTPILTAIGGAQTQINAPQGSLSISAPATGAQKLVIPNDLGGALHLSAENIQESGAIVLPSGLITLQATNNINVAPSALIDASGRNVTIVNQTVGTEGGNISMTAGGNMSLAAGSVLNVSGAGDAPAGAISLTAPGTVDVQSTLKGHGGAGAVGGGFSVDAGQLPEGLTALSALLGAGGFTNAESVTARSGDLNLAAGAQLTANQVALTADAGSVNIAGTINAPGAGLRGQINLFGSQGVTLESTGQLQANTIGGEGIGGNIELGTSGTGSVTLSPGSVISARGVAPTGQLLTGAASDGQLLIRAPLINNDVAVNLAGSNLTHLAQIIVEPVMTMAIGSTPTAADFADIQTAVGAAMDTAGAPIAARLNPSGSLPMMIRPALDLEQSGSLSLANSLDLSTWRFGGQPVDLSFRVGGSITVGGTISDGFSVSAGDVFTPSVISMLPGSSSSIRFIAGADQSSVNPFATLAAGKADLTLNPGAVVRTGTGEIDLIASGNVVFGNPGTTGVPSAQVYTGGLAGSPTTQVSLSNSYFNFPTSGGNILVNAGGSVLGSPVTQAITAWQIRKGNDTRPVNWGVDYDQFGWNLGSLGGGDVSITAGGDVLNLTAAAADSYATPTKTSPSTYFASGGLTVRAGGDIGNGQFFEAQGSTLLSAGGAFSTASPVARGPLAGSLIALGNSQVTIEARLGAVIDAVANPTVLDQLAANNTSSLSSSYFTYGDESKLVVQSTFGDVTLGGSTDRLNAFLGSAVGNGYGAAGVAGQIYPATLLARSLQGDLSIGGVTLFASDNGQLQLLAGGNIVGTGPLVMSDAAAAAVPTPQAPGAGGQPSGVATAPFASGRHANDSSPVLITAGLDIDNLNVSVPKASQLVAGQDINNLIFFGQNINPSDVTSISSGRDFLDSLGRTDTVVGLGGPGKFDLSAGRNVNLGFSQGISTSGNLSNPNLPIAAGADVTVIAGTGQAGPDYSDFLSKIVAPNTSYQASLITYIQSLTGQKNLSLADAEAAFGDLTNAQQTNFIDQVFFGELSSAAGLVNTNPTAGFAQGYAAIDALFPNSRTATQVGMSPYQGNISLAFSRIYTLNGGGITLLTPGGDIDVGLANPPASLADSRSPSQLGIVAQGPGDINIYSKSDVNVNSSRVFTLGGGNILIWSNEGSIDAGQGAKSSISAPPPQLLVDSSGNVTVDLSGAVAGSGIRTIQIDPSVAAGNVALIAPEGTVNAGDAGIGAAGDITIFALHVVGLDNINFGGTAVGVPAVVGSLGASLAGVSSAGSSATNSATGAAQNTAEKEASSPLAQTALSWLDVFVTGLGEDNCKPEDMECLKRQRSSTP